MSSSNDCLSLAFVRSSLYSCWKPSIQREEASRASLQRDYGGAVSVRAGNAEVVVPLDLPLGSIGDVCLKWHSQFDQVDGGGAPNNNVWKLVSGDNVLEEVVLTWKVSCDLQSRWQVALAKVKNDCQDIIMPGGVAPQGNGLLAGV